MNLRTGLSSSGTQNGKRTVEQTPLPWRLASLFAKGRREDMGKKLGQNVPNSWSSPLRQGLRLSAGGCGMGAGWVLLRKGALVKNSQDKSMQHLTLFSLYFSVTEVTDAHIRKLGKQKKYETHIQRAYTQSQWLIFYGFPFLLCMHEDLSVMTGHGGLCL